MNETVENLVQGLLDIIYDLDECCIVEDNQKALALLDARSADLEISDLEEKVEALEWAEDDYYVIDKDDLDVIVSKALGKMFYTTSGVYLPTEEGDYDNWVDDAVDELKEAIEPFVKKGKTV